MDDLSAMYRCSLDQDSGLPGEVYTSEAVFAEEIRRLFHASWLCVGIDRDVPEAGDLFPVGFAGTPLLLVRDAEHKVRVFHNACAHRGALLATGPRSCRGSIVCPYHHWAYGLDGALRRTPHAGGAGKHHLPESTEPRPRLTEVRSAVWNGLVFVNLSGSAVPFEDFIAPVDQRIGPLQQTRMTWDSSLAAEMTFEANWKLVVENFVESYHVPAVHPELERVNPMRAHYQILGGHSYLGQGGHDYVATEQQDLAGLPLRENADPGKYEVFYIYPNLIFGPVPNFGFVIIANPCSAEVTQERLEFFFYGESAMTAENEPLRRSNADFLKRVNCEDIEICKSVQAGRHSLAFNGGVFALPQEKTSLQFLKMVAANMLRDERQMPDEIISLPTEDIHHETRSR